MSELLDLDEFYPGSKMPRRALPLAEITNGWDAKPLRFTVGGTEREFFSIGALAQALARKPATLRKWEQLGILPRARFHSPGVNAHGQFRLYTRKDVETIVTIAREEGLIGTTKQVQATRFVERVGRYWNEEL